MPGVTMTMQVAPKSGIPRADGTKADGNVRPAKLFIGGITRNTTTKLLHDHFSQFGRVLDCVAMRLPDGRPRSFGYVTFDSQAAAERCLSEPQVIDERVVDLKLAVPEGSASAKDVSVGVLPRSKNKAGARPVPASICTVWPEAAPFACGPGYGSPNSAWWPDTFQSLDCVDLLSAGYHDPTSLLMMPGLLPSPLATATPGMLSAYAPEFVPFGFQGGATPTGTLSTAPLPPGMLSTSPHTPTGLLATAPPPPRQVPVPEQAIPAAPAQQAPTPTVQPEPACARMPFADVTNVKIHEADKSKDMVKETSKPMVAKFTAIGEAARTILSTAPRKFTQLTHSEDFFIAVDDDCMQNMTHEEKPEDDAAHGSEHADELATPMTTPSGSEAVSTPIGTGMVDENGELPSLGSAEHATGECRRCNFFLKGRCLNGKDCTFCHFPHEKRKPSRQEKRERRSTWLTEQDGQSMDDQHQADENQYLVNEPASVLFTQPALPTSSPICATKLPAPLKFPCTMPPPGLLPPCMQEFGQPEEEVSPLAPMVATCYGTAAPSNSGIHQVLATTPTSMPNYAKEMCTVATQTVDYACLQCEANGIHSEVKDNEQDPMSKKSGGGQWSREELLKIRGGVVGHQAAIDDGAPVVFRTVPLANFQ